MRVWLLWLLFLPTLATAEEWQISSHEPGLTLYTRAVPGQDLKAFRCVVRIHAPARTVAYALMDIARMPSWFFRLREARRLDAGQPGEALAYLWIQGLWPVADRDVVLQLRPRREPGSAVLQITASALPSAYPPMRERVRIPRLQASWTLTPVSATQTDLVLEGQADPGGAIPLWLANLVVVELPRSSLRDLRLRVESPAFDLPSLLADPGLQNFFRDVEFPESRP